MMVNFRQKAIRLIWGIPLTAALMFVLNLAGLYAFSPLFTGDYHGLVSYIGLCLICTAMAGAIGIRIARLQWQETILAALLFVICLILLLRFGGFGPTGLQFPPLFILITLIFASPGGFLLSSFVPVVRQAGSSIKTLNWVVCFMIATYVARLDYFHVREILAPPLPIPAYFNWLAMILALISPTCIAVAWLRLTGVKWQQARLLFIFVPVIVWGMWFTRNFRIAD